MHTSVNSNSHPQAVNGGHNIHAVQITDVERSGNAYPDGIDDDNILEVPHFHSFAVMIALTSAPPSFAFIFLPS